MTPKEEAKNLIGIYVNQSINFPYIDSEDVQCIGSGYMTYKSAKACALIHIDGIISALVEYGKESMELQNMDSEFRYWYSVKEAVKSL